MDYSLNKNTRNIKFINMIIISFMSTNCPHFYLLGPVGSTYLNTLNPIPNKMKPHEILLGRVKKKIVLFFYLYII